ncbi:MAG: GGDEF domain-containing protein [Clostridiales Family XIII bacterium]|nr:GGDEF domain-containing protein [Clostridiales Family XIII bacterium]
MDALSDEDHREFAEALQSFVGMVTEMRSLASSLSRGDLDIPLPPSDNELASPLKALHATLKHLTWQTKQVSMGDYTQKINFMGEFSKAFNEMVVLLELRKAEAGAEMERANTQAQELARTNSMFEAITSNMEEWIVMVDKESGEHLFANHPAASVLTSDTFEQQLYDILFEYAHGMESDDEPKKEDFMLISDVAIQYFEMMLYPIRWFERDAVACVLSDVTESKEQYSKLEDVAYRDVSTGVFNRLYGMKALEEWVDEQTAFRLIFVDMDMLKYVNDVFGHGEGDVYIKSVADLLQEISPVAIVCRLGGDEFMVLLKERDTEGRDMEQVLEDLRTKLVESSTKADDGSIRYNRSVSYGIVGVSNENTQSASEILALADDRMYQYKKAHKKERRV